MKAKQIENRTKKNYAKIHIHDYKMKLFQIHRFSSPVLDLYIHVGKSVYE